MPQPINTPYVSLHPTQGEPMALPCPYCGSLQLYLMGISACALNAPMEMHVEMFEGNGHELPRTYPKGSPAVSISFCCLTCDKWAYLGMNSGLADGTWLLFEKASEHG